MSMLRYSKRKLGASPSNIKRDTTTLRLVIHVFPRFGLLQFACFNCEFWLALRNIFTLFWLAAVVTFFRLKYTV